jgi:hypothetical protein
LVNGFAIRIKGELLFESHESANTICVFHVEALHVEESLEDTLNVTWLD